ncbi:MAG: hypothetical protein KJ880_00835 [Candidatus Omnitrophica bacterium]|nr:hypothetical protein [Candidatus Omnitrophota bacterium]MBU1868941.1 hypothetical protein [Candidatus Omnitrophota bacterium]
MDTHKTKSLKNIEEKMQEVEPGSLRYKILENAKYFKSSWIELGQALYSVWKDKIYKEWGYSAFDIYTAKEVGVRKETAMKLLRSYYFLEKEEPQYLKSDYIASSDAATVPTFESVDVLRTAKNKKLDNHDYESLKKEIFEKGKDFREVKKDLTSMIRQRQELEPEEAYEKKRLAMVRRLIGSLKSIRQEAETLKLLPAPLLKEISSLVSKLEQEIS